VIIVEHRLDLVARIATRMLVLDEGRAVFSGTPREILSKIDVGLHGVTEPTIVRLAKLVGINGESLPVDPEELSNRLGPPLRIPRAE
jgi:energy-coupling factor transporter ATP-binding protein EcfA2